MKIEQDAARTLATCDWCQGRGHHVQRSTCRCLGTGPGATADLLAASYRGEEGAGAGWGGEGSLVQSASRRGELHVD